MNLVVGATGQLGTAIVRKLVDDHQPVRAFVRKTSHYEHLQRPEIQLAQGDLRDPDSIDKALNRVDVVIATANAIIPRGSGTQEQVEDFGYANLFAACKRAKIQQFILVSAGKVEGAEDVPVMHYKALNEKRLIDSGIAYTIFRADAFMEVWLPLIGSQTVLRGEYLSQPEKSFWFFNLFNSMVGGMVEKRGRAIIAGRPGNHHTMISLHDVATFVVRATCNEAAYNRVFDLGGPETLTWDETVAILSKVLDRPVRGIYTPAGVFKVMSAIMRPFAPNAANIMGLNVMGAMTDVSWDMTDTARLFGVSHMTSVEELLRNKLALPAD